MVNFNNGTKDHGNRIFWICLFALVVSAIAVPDAGAYSRYSVNRDATNCGSCHGDFRASNYVSLMDGKSWGNLHDLHRTAMLGGDCDVCHGGSSRFPVLLDVSTGGSGLQAISCMGCHGRSQDAGHDDTSGGLGAGLRQHHTNAGVTGCQGCHSDANPSNYTPVGENVKPPYYASPGTGHPNMPTDSCNLDGKENFAGSLRGLDNDGDKLYDAADPDCVKPSSRINFDGDRKTDITIWRPSNGIWYTLKSSNGFDPAQYQWMRWGEGAQNDILVPGDYDGDGKTDWAIWRPAIATWYIKQSSDNVIKALPWGDPTDIPVPGDYDGDGKTDLAVWRPATATWYIKRSSDNAVRATQWGGPADTPVPGDYDGDGKTDVAVWRSSTATWYVKRSLDNVVMATQWGNSTDIVVPADYDGDGRTDMAVWRPSTAMWYIRQSADTAVKAIQWGSPTDIPVPGYYDGDGKADAAVWRQSTTMWYIKQSSDGQVKAFKWGDSTDAPVMSMY